MSDSSPLLSLLPPRLVMPFNPRTSLVMLLQNRLVVESKKEVGLSPVDCLPTCILSPFNPNELVSALWTSLIYPSTLRPPSFNLCRTAPSPPRKTP
jgi:hypothetical protein